MHSLSASVRACLASLVLAALLPAAAADPVRYDNHVVARIEVTSPEQLTELLALAADVWSEQTGLGPVDFMFRAADLPALDVRGIDYHVWVPDVQALIDNERASAGRGWFDDYHPQDDIVAYLYQLEAAYPQLAQVFTAGYTLENRPIEGIRIASPAVTHTSPAVIYFAGEHAREWIGPTVPQYLATHLLEHYGLDPLVTDLVDHVEWLLIPVFNVDGYIYTWTTDRLWRKNRRLNADGSYGVDINRNWGYGWGLAGSSSYPNSGTYRGTAPFSEPETQALRDMFLQYANVRAQIDIHSYSQLILWPWGYTAELCPDQAVYEPVGLAMQQLIQGVHGLFYDAGPIYTTIYPVSGSSVDWTYGEQDIFSWSFELRDTGQYGFILPANQIIPNNEEILPAILHLTNSAEVRATQFRFPYELPAQVIVGQLTNVSAVVTSGVEGIDTASAQLHYRFHPQQEFAAIPMSFHLTGLFRARLPYTNCNSTPEYYFSIQTDAGLLTSPLDAPASVYTAPVISGAEVLDEALSNDPGWITEGQWAWGQPLGLGGAHGEPDPEAGHTGLNVYGYNLAGDYTNGMSEHHLTSTPIDCTGQYGLRLGFWRWLGVEQPPYDRARVRISADGVNWTLLWENQTEIADDRWVYQEFDVAAVADNQPAVYLRWSLGPTDSGWAYCGWNIDDVQIYATGCAEVVGDANCDGRLDFGDIKPVVLLLANPAVYEATWPWCPPSNGDIDGSGSVDFGDINPFVAALSMP
jgi:murein tripeptide amidase MpaA